MSRAVVYLRVSTDKQDMKNQKFEITNFCKKRGIEVTEWIEDTVSGTVKMQDRKIGKILEELQTGDTLIVSEISRISRNLLQIMDTIRRCLETGISVFTVKEGYVLDNGIQSKILAFAFGISAEIERSLISQRTKEALARKKAEGKILGRPVGAKGKVLKLDPKRDEVMRLLESKVSYEAIGRLTGTSRRAVENFVKRHAEAVAAVAG